MPTTTNALEFTGDVPRHVENDKRQLAGTARGTVHMQILPVSRIVPSRAPASTLQRRSADTRNPEYRSVEPPTTPSMIRHVRPSNRTARRVQSACTWVKQLRSRCQWHGHCRGLLRQSDGTSPQRLTIWTADALYRVGIDGEGNHEGLRPIGRDCIALRGPRIAEGLSGPRARSCISHKRDHVDFVAAQRIGGLRA